MAYLSLDSSVFLGNYDSLVESCFDYAFEREDECLFEEMVLQELSQDKKLRAARRAAFPGMSKNGILDSLRVDKGFLNNAKNMPPDEEDTFMGKNFNLMLAKSQLSKTGKVLAGKRKRLLKYLENTPEGTRFKKFSDDKEADTVVDSSYKEAIDRITKGMSDENVHKEYNELRKEIEELNKNNPKIKKKNKNRLFKTTVQQSAPVNNKLVPIQTSSDNNKENQKEETESKKEQEQSQNTENSKETVNNNSKSENSDKASRIAKIKSRIRAIIDSLKKKYNTIKSNIQNTPTEKRSLLQKFMNKIIQMIDKFKGLLNK